MSNGRDKKGPCRTFKNKGGINGVWGKRERPRPVSEERKDNQ